MTYPSSFFKLLIILTTLVIVSCSSNKDDQDNTDDQDPIETLSTAFEKGLVNYKSSLGSVLTPLKAASDYNKLADTEKAATEGLSLLAKSKLNVMSAETTIIGEIDFSNFYLEEKVKYKLYKSYSFENHEIIFPEAVAVDQIDSSLGTIALIKANVTFTELDNEGNPTGITSNEENLFDNAKSASEKWQYLLPSYKYPHIAYIKKTSDAVLSTIGTTLSYTGCLSVTLSSTDSQVRQMNAAKKFENVKLNVTMAGAVASVTSEKLNLGADFDTYSGNNIQYIELTGLTTGANPAGIKLTRMDNNVLEDKGVKAKIIFGGDKAQEIGLASAITITGKILAITAVGTKDPAEATEN